MVNFKKPKNKKKTVKSSKPGMKIKKAITAIVKKEQARNTENKTFQYYDIAKQIYPSVNALFSTSIDPMTPYPAFLQITQGVGEGSRVGNEIKIKRLTVKGNIYQKPYNATTNPTPFPCHVKIWFYYDKQNPCDISYTASDFLQLGSSSRPLFNDLLDLWYPVNEDRYRVLATKSFKLGYASNTGTGSVVAQAYASNNDYKFNHQFSFDLTKHCIKNVKFNDNSSIASTRGIFMMATVVQANGAPYNNAVVPAEMQYVLDVEYEDA